MPQDITPEEKLLKLIKEGDRPEKKEENVLAPKEAQPSFISLPEVSKELPSKKNHSIHSIRNLSFLSIFFIVIMIFVLGYQYLGGGSVLPLPLHKMAGTESFDLPVRKNTAVESFDGYAKAFNSRNVFKTIGTPPPISSPTEKALGLTELSRNLNVSGIIAGSSPQAVIEDKSNGQVYYVRSGDRVGQIQVKEVRDDGVLLQYGDEERQLTL